MYRTVKVTLSLCWTAVFGALAVVSLITAVDGIEAARAAMPFAFPLLNIDPLATQPLMGGLSLGSAMVTALFSWMLLTALLVEEDYTSSAATNPVELAHGGAFGIAGVIFLTTILDASIPLALGSGLVIAALVVSLMLARAVPEPRPVYAPREVRDRAIEAAHVYSTDMRQQVYSMDVKQQSAEIVAFPLRGEFARGGQ